MIRSFDGKNPRISDSAFISEAAYIIGDVEIGEKSSVWPGAVIRGDLGKVIIGQNSVVEDNCVIHSGSPNTKDSIQEIVIGDNVQIGHGAIVNCHVVGSNTLLGMNCTILHDAEIGSFCIIAAACVVGEGMVVPDMSFVAGVPGKIKGTVSEKQLWWVREGPAGYSKLATRYKRQNL